LLLLLGLGPVLFEFDLQMIDSLCQFTGRVELTSLLLQKLVFLLLNLSYLLVILLLHFEQQLQLQFHLVL
jgi:hypothetical protein